MASYESFALDEMRRRRPGEITDALLALAARPNMFAVEMLQRRTGVALIPEGEIVHAVFSDRGAEWRGCTLEIPHTLPDTLLASIVGRSVGKVVDVATGGHLVVRDSKCSGGPTRLICADHLATPPIVGAWSMTAALLLIAWHVSMAYIAIAFWNVVDAIRKPSPYTALNVGMIVMGVAIGIMMAMSSSTDLKKAFYVVFMLMAPALFAFWPPKGWRSDMARRLSGR